MIALPLAFSVRNVLRTETIPRLRALLPDWEVHIVVPDVDAVRDECRRAGLIVHAMDDIAPSPFERVLGKLRLLLIRGLSVTARLRTEPSSRFVAVLVDLCTRLVGKTWRIRLLRLLGWVETRFSRRRPYRTLVSEVQPSLVIVSRVFGWSGDHWILLEAARQRVPVVGLVSSWDNLSSKPFPMVGFRSLVLWNEVMKEEAEQLYGFKPSSLYIAGVPRFDAYFRRTAFRSRAEVFEELGLDPQRRLILYATGSQGRFPSADARPVEPRVAASVASIVSNTLGDTAQVLVRLHPQADPREFEFDCRGVVVHVPGSSEGFLDRNFGLREEQLLGETLIYSDIVINIASTITIEAAIFDTPVICIGFHPDGTAAADASMREYYTYDHYRQLGVCNGFRLATSTDALKDLLLMYLNNPTIDQIGRGKIVVQQCKYTDGDAGVRVAEFIASIAEPESSQ